MESSKADTILVNCASMMLLAAEKAAASKSYPQAPQGLVTKCGVEGKEIETRHELEIYHQTVTASAEKTHSQKGKGS